MLFRSYKCEISVKAQVVIGREKESRSFLALWERGFFQAWQNGWLTEAGAALNQAVRAIEEDLGAGSTAVLLAPAVLADRLRAALDALAGERIDDASRAVAG